MIMEVCKKCDVKNEDAFKTRLADQRVEKSREGIILKLTQIVLRDNDPKKMSFMADSSSYILHRDADVCGPRRLSVNQVSRNILLRLRQ